MALEFSKAGCWHAETVSRVTVRTAIRRFENGTFVSRPDVVAGEEPLEIRIAGRPISTTMRTPGHDIELVHGLLHAEGIITGPHDVIAARYCAGVDSAGQNTYNVLDVALADPSAAAELIAPRAFVTSSACGVCGTSSIEALQRVTRYALPTGPLWDPQLITALPDLLRTQQLTFRKTGGLHAAALVRPDGRIERVREDVGRHNAVDKVIGSAILADELPITDRALLTSSRASFELVQKAVMAGIGMLVAVSAPSSLAVQLATETGLTLVGFTSARGFNLYSGAQRISGSGQ
jgi:FdhD protein